MLIRICPYPESWVPTQLVPLLGQESPHWKLHSSSLFQIFQYKTTVTYNWSSPVNYNEIVKTQKSFSFVDPPRLVAVVLLGLKEEYLPFETPTYSLQKLQVMSLSGLKDVSKTNMLYMNKIHSSLLKVRTTYGSAINCYIKSLTQDLGLTKRRISHVLTDGRTGRMEQCTTLWLLALQLKLLSALLPYYTVTFLF